MDWFSRKSEKHFSIESETDHFLMSRSGPFTRTSNSPSVPARSPFRIRDSQQSTNASSHKHVPPSPRATTTTATAAAAAVPPSFFDDRATGPMQQPSRLSLDVSQIWKHKPPPTPDQHANKDDGETKSNMDELLKQVLVSQALVDADNYKMLPFEKVDELKKQQAILRDQIDNLRLRLGVAKQVRDACNSLVQLDTAKSSNNSHDDNHSVLERSMKATQQVESIAVELMSLIVEEAEIQQQILQHTASALRVGQLTSNVHLAPVSPIAPTPMLSPLPPTPVDDHSRQELEQLTTALDAFVRRYQLTTSTANLQRSDSGFSSHSEWSVLLSTMESEFKDYKSKIERLERQLESNEEKLRLESMSSKKYEVQLRMAQEKREMAEARCRELEQSKGNLDKELAELDASLTGMTYTKERVAKLESELLEMTHRAEQAEAELSSSQSQMGELQASVADLELRSTRAESEASSAASREKSLTEEVSALQSELAAMRAEKQRWERALKRESVLQMMEGGSESYKAKYQQQMEEQRQEYEAQLKEQQAFLDKTLRAKEQLVSDNEKMTSICKDLEDLIRDKSRIIDARDVRINQLEQELVEAQQRNNAAETKSNNNAEIAELQRAFTEREKAWLDQSAAMETNFEGIMKEFDRLTISAMEFETDRMKYEQRIDRLTRDIQALEAELTEKKINELGHDTAEGPTTASLRKEFRKLVSDLKADHQRVLDRETKEKRSLEGRLRDMKHEREMARYERVNRGVQTYFIPDV
ncbi:Up-regulated during septation-domain-containing protein [Dichotomocladium elegans]|nr:Up-regulated during septation-domain-containing protein [Dichotomocladium elegans]